jgi:hypothetical protein
VRYCTRCGSALRGAARFCTQCGAPVGRAAGPVREELAAGPGIEAAEPPLPGAGAPLPAGRPAPGYEPGAFATVELPPAVASPGLPPLGRVPGGRSGMAVAIAAGLMIVLAGGGLAWTYLRHHPAAAAAPGAAGPARGSHGGGSQPPASPSPPASSPFAPGARLPSSVAIAPGARQQPGAQQVASFVQRYFIAIDSHNYGEYIALFQPRLRPTRGQFGRGYRGTTDSGATLAGLSATAQGLAAAVTFTSHQPPANSPTHTSCTAWEITLYLQQRGHGYRIVSPPPGYHAHYRAC